MFDITIQDRVARLTLMRPERRNAIPLGGWAELGARAAEAEALGARLLILGGVPGQAFCSRADVSDFGSFRNHPQARTEFRLAIRNGLERLRNVSIPTIAAVDGPCYGAGVALAMACDLRFAGPAAAFAITPAKLGIGYPQEDVHRLVALVGPGQAARLLFSAAPIDGPEARRIGLAERFGEVFEAELAAFAAAIAVHDRDSLAMLKRGIGLAAKGVDTDAAQDQAFDSLLGSELLARHLAAHRSRAR